MRRADRKELVSSPSKALTMQEMPFNNSTATTGRAELWRCEKTDTPTLVVDSKVDRVDSVEALQVEAASVVVVAVGMV